MDAARRHREHQSGKDFIPLGPLPLFQKPELLAGRKRHYASHNTHNTQNCPPPPPFGDRAKSANSILKLVC
jgi:hypothetical protein